MDLNLVQHKHRSGQRYLKISETLNILWKGSRST